MTASKPELSQSNFTAPPVSKNISWGRREARKERAKERHKDKREVFREATQLSPSMQCTNQPLPITTDRATLVVFKH